MFSDILDIDTVKSIPLKFKTMEHFLSLPIQRVCRQPVARGCTRLDANSEYGMMTISILMDWKSMDADSMLELIDDFIEAAQAVRQEIVALGCVDVEGVDMENSSISRKSSSRVVSLDAEPEFKKFNW